MQSKHQNIFLNEEGQIGRLTSSTTNNKQPMDQYDDNHRSYIEDPDYPAIEAKAKARGFRKATADEVRASANSVRGAPDLFRAYGGLWKKA